MLAHVRTLHRRKLQCSAPVDHSGLHIIWQCDGGEGVECCSRGQGLKVGELNVVQDGAGVVGGHEWEAGLGCQGIQVDLVIDLHKVPRKVVCQALRVGTRTALTRQQQNVAFYNNCMLQLWSGTMLRLLMQHAVEHVHVVCMCMWAVVPQQRRSA